MWIGAITQNGAELLARWAGGEEVLHIDKATYGTGTVPTSSMSQSTAVAGEVGDAEIVGKTQNANNVSFQVQIGAAEESAYTVHQVGIWAHVGEEDTTSKLIALYQEEDGAYIPIKGDDQTYVYTLYATVATGYQGTIEVTFDGGAYATMNSLNNTVAGAIATLKAYTDAYFPVSVANGGSGVTVNPSMLTNLGSTSADAVFKASPRPGVTGILPVANGGTGASTAQNAAKSIVPAYMDGPHVTQKSRVTVDVSQYIGTLSFAFLVVTENGTQGQYLRGKIFIVSGSSGGGYPRDITPDTGAGACYLNYSAKTIDIQFPGSAQNDNTYIIIPLWKLDT